MQSLGCSVLIAIAVPSWELVYITLPGSKAGLPHLELISELSSAIAFLRLKNAIALLSSEMSSRQGKPTFDPGRVISTLWHGGQRENAAHARSVDRQELCSAEVERACR